MELEKRETLPKYLPQICQFLAIIGASFPYCASIIEVMANEKATAKALAAVVQEHDSGTYVYLPSGEKKIVTSYKCWRVKNVSEMNAASLFLGEKKQPAILDVSLGRKQQIPSNQLLSFLKTVAEEFNGKLNLWLQYSYYNYEPVDNPIEQLEGAR